MEDKNALLHAAIQGEKLKRIPFSVWTHFPEIDRQPELIAQKTYELFKEFDLDFIKVMSNGMFAIEDYGAQIDYSEVASGGVAKLVSSPIQDLEDWNKIGILDIEKGALGRELDHLSRVLDLVGGEAPVLMTVFSPLTVAYKLIGDRHQLLQGDGFIQALNNIASTMSQLSQRAIEMGASGVYFAAQSASYDLLSASQYLDTGRPYDLKALQGAQKGWFNTIHIHGINTMFEWLHDYPVQVVNWHIWETLPDVDEGQIVSQKAIMGGLNRGDITAKNRNSLRNQVFQSIKLTQGHGLILSPGCVIRHPFAGEMIHYIRQTKAELEAKMLD